MGWQIRTTKVILLFLLLFSSVSVYGLYENDEFQDRQCREQCDTNLVLSSEGGSELFCNRECAILSCNKGCSLYKSALASSCPKACAAAYQEDFNSTQLYTGGQDEMRYCIQGCIFGVDDYINYVVIKLTPLMEEPRPERESIGHASLTLKWLEPELSGIQLSYRMHVRVVGVDSDWHFHKDAEFIPHKIIVTNLHPYVTYQFKVMVFLSESPVTQSLVTVEITTLAHGKPSNAPTISSITTPSPTVISLSWKPPLFPNGKLLSYRIYVEPVGNRHLNKTTIEIPHNATSWLLSQLKSSQPYVISMSARNAEGEGPRTNTTITTPNPGNLSAQDTPYLILGSSNTIVKRNALELISGISVTIHSLTQGTVRGLSLHVARQLLLATNSAGDVLRVSLEGVNTTKDLKKSNRLLSSNHYPSILGARAVTIDWLADRVYVASWNKITWQIHSCPLEKDQCVPIVEKVHRPITDVKVDPINGYLYYVINGQGHGLYRIDLQNITDFLSGRSSSTSGTLIAPMPDLHTLVLDFSSVHLYVVNDTTKTMMSAFLDGTNMQPFHHSNINSAFQHVTSTVFYNGTFIWTDNLEMYVENYESNSKIYHHNELTFFAPNYTGLNIYHPTAQPTPVPSVAPDKLEVLFTKDKALVQWKPPKQWQYQGQGAWNKWTYQLHISSENEKDKKIDSSLTAAGNTKLTIENLKPGSEYAIKIRAKSSIGTGPWSESFVGKTWKEAGLKVLIGVDGGRIVERTLGESANSKQINFFNNALDIAWHDDIVMWTTDEFSLSIMNVSNNHRRQLNAVNEAVSVSYDWLGQKVYWGEVHSAQIRRADINGITSSSEYIRRSLAQDLAVDAVAGRLYWTTEYSVQTSLLNGIEHQDLFRIKPFTGRRVISLAVDTDSSKIFWFVKGSQVQDIYMRQMIQTEDGHYFSPKERLIGDFTTISKYSKLQCFSGKLFWMTKGESLVVSDVNHHFMASVSEFNNITAFAIKHPQIHKIPYGLSRESVRVIPDPIRSPDIKTVGDWSKFNLTWPPSTEVNHGKVFYKVRVEFGGKPNSSIVSRNWYELSGLSPYTQMDVNIQPYTVWGFADPTTVSVRSPMRNPTAPLAPEVYIKPFKNTTTSAQSLAADFRWNSPHLANGIISHHIVTHWMGTGRNERNRKVVRVPGTARHFILPNLIKSQTYHFNVVACNDAGCGPPSVTKTATTDALNPIPTLLIASKESLQMREMDARLDRSTVLADIALHAVTFLSHDPPRIFWLDQTRKFLYENVKRPHIELTKLNGRGKGMTIDWISRTLYVVEDIGSRKNAITEFNVDTRVYKQLVVRNAEIGNVIADPYNGAVMWTEIDTEGRGQIFNMDIHSKNVRSVLGSTSQSDRDKRSTCSCGRAMNVSPAMAIDYTSGDGSTRIILTDMNTKAIYSSDIDGCDCQKILPLSDFNGLDTAPDLLTVDHMQVSCYSKSQGKLYAVKKNEKTITIERDIPNVLDIVAYGSHLQPLPDSGCLDPGAYNHSVHQIQVKNDSIDLGLSAPTRPVACRRITSPVDKYTVYYKPLVRTKAGTAPVDCQAEITECFKKVSYSTRVTLSDLQPYTPYLIQVAVSNYYTEYLSEEMGTPITLTTKYGVPHNAKELSVAPETPNMISVRWSPPDVLNGPANQIFYTVLYSTTTSHGFEQKELLYNDTLDNFEKIYIEELRPDHPYNISIRVCLTDKTRCNVSHPVSIRTFRTPTVLGFRSVTHNSMEIRWTVPNSVHVHHVEYQEVDGSDEENWFRAESHYEEAVNFTDTITHLKPNTQYAFRIKAKYVNEEDFSWPPKTVIRRTLSYIPERPEAPIVTASESGAYEVSWEEPNDNGATITQYLLQYRDPDKNAWLSAYEGPKDRWLVEESKLNQGHKYMFRVAAVNAYGQSLFSENSTAFMASYGKALDGSFTTEVTIGIILGCICLLGLFVLAVILILRKRFVKIKTHQFIIRGPDNELATLRELPHTTFQQSNTLYAISIQCTDEEIAKLPHFSRSQLVLHTFLGSGAFGEVFEGFAKNILGDESGETKCAVKTLRKSASDQEKQEFLKEALLMKNFQHEHILSLLGVCLDNDPQFIIMELMEGGDLLSFIRSCRATSTTPAKLMLPELVKICVHVARGCKYLEDMHFVHRDLAARNCLVSSKSPSDMIVKIGDFGLARDIYKNDYYRKEGEGLLPVRWMSPESLVDGFFTTQSDIWAFGVMMWEVITLGQQPYPARTNIEVLHFVRAGGKLERPERCADEMYSLMRKCWSFDAEERPCFADILSTLEEFEEKCIHMTFEEIARLSPLSVDANPCMNFHHAPHQFNHENSLYHDPQTLHNSDSNNNTSPAIPILTSGTHLTSHANTQRPLPEIPIINPILHNTSHHVYHRVDYPNPWDIQEIYATPRISSIQNVPANDTIQSFDEYQIHQNTFDTTAESSTRCQFSNFTGELLGTNTQTHDYLLPSSSETNTLDENLPVVNGSDDLTIKSGYDENSGNCYNIANVNSSSHHDRFSCKKKRSKRRNLFSSHVHKSHKLKKKNKTRAICSYDISDSNELYMLMDAVNGGILHQYERMDSNNTNNNNNNDDSFTSRLNGSLRHFPNTPLKENNNDKCLSCYKQYTAHSGSAYSLPILDTSRCSPDEGIWSPSLSNFRKNKSYSITSQSCNFCRSNSWTYSSQKRTKRYKKYKNKSHSSLRSKARIFSEGSHNCLHGVDASVSEACFPVNSDARDTYSSLQNNISSLNSPSNDEIHNSNHNATNTLSERHNSSHLKKTKSRHHWSNPSNESSSPSSLTSPHAIINTNKLFTHHHVTYTEKTLGLTNIAFTDEAANRELGVWTNEDEEEEESEQEAETRGLFIPKCQTITAGGSVRATQSDKAKRLSDLLGTTDKQVVDLTNIKRKRNHSDSKQYSPLSSSPYHHSDFPAARDYDRHGYLEPRGAKGGNRYLDLVNYAPELRHLLDSQGKPLVSMNGSAFTPVHVNSKGYHPSNPAYSLVAHDEEYEEEIPYGHIVGKQQGSPRNSNGVYSMDNPNYTSDRSGAAASNNDYPIYAEVCDARRHNSTDSTGGRYTDYHYNSPSLSATMMKSPRRKYSDQDLYSNPVAFRQYPEPDTSGDPRYTSVECNNNNHHSSNSYGYGPSRHRHGSSNSNRSRESSANYHHYAKPGLCSSFCQEEPLCVDLSNTTHNSKLSLPNGQDHWANNPDDVFLDSDCPMDSTMSSSQYSYNQGRGQLHSGSSRSRHQVYPENNPDYSSFSHGHVSLV